MILVQEDSRTLTIQYVLSTEWPGGVNVFISTSPDPFKPSSPFPFTSYFRCTEGEEVPLEIFKTNKKQCPILVVSYVGGVLVLSALTL